MPQLCPTAEVLTPYCYPFPLDFTQLIMGRPRCCFRKGDYTGAKEEVQVGRPQRPITCEQRYLDVLLFVDDESNLNALLPPGDAPCISQ